MAEAFILGAVRSPIGRFRGGLRDIRSDDLLGQVIAKLVQRTAIAGDSIDDVICGCANQAGEDNRNVARMALLLAGLPQSVPGVTVNRLCGSGLEAVLRGVAGIDRVFGQNERTSDFDFHAYLRAAILKACINRSHRVRHGLSEDFQYVHEELDVNQDHPAYRLGRLFAVLERIQSPAAKPSINATIRDRYYGAASSTPVAVFTTVPDRVPVFRLIARV